MLSLRPDSRVEPLTLAVLKAVASVAGALDRRWFVAGAMGRDILLDGVYGLPPGIATRDIDLAVAVANWGQFEALRAALIATGHFAAVPRVTQRLLYHHPDSQGNGYPLDILPFGGVEDESGVLAWPPDGDVVMNVTGYEEAHASAVKVELERGFVVRVASLPGLAVLKIFAWRDRGHESPKDAADLVTIFRNYLDAGNRSRLYDKNMAILEAVDHKLELAGPRLLGSDVRQIFAPETMAKLERLLSPATTVSRLVTDMARALPTSEDSISAAEELLNQFLLGLRGR